MTEKHVLMSTNLICLVTKHLKFEQCSSEFTKMAERMDIEAFFEEIDPDLLKYASAFCKCGFSSSVTMKYWCKQDFQNLDVEVPEGHCRLILNMVTKIRTPELKSGENRLSFIPLTGKVNGNLRKSSVTSRRYFSGISQKHI